jgi:hypothetical protein
LKKKQELVKMKVEKARTSKNAFAAFLIRGMFSSVSWCGFGPLFTVLRVSNEESKIF